MKAIQHKHCLKQTRTAVGRKAAISTAFAVMLSTSSALAAPVLMSPEWAESACSAWNQNATLTTELAGKWADNNGERGHKIIQMYVLDCADAPTAELRISPEGDKAMCSYGGAVQGDSLDSGKDYIMYAKAKHWARMGSGEDGPMKAMSLGRLKFKGPKLEAMSVMGPFAAFLKLTGEVDSAEGCGG